MFSARANLNKPEPAIFELAAACFGSAPGELVLLGETGPKVQAARAPGWSTLPFSAAAQAEAELAQHGW